LSSKPKYMIIFEWLSEQIRNKTIKPGDKIPNENELAAMFNVHRMTVRQAIDKLVDDHMLVRKRSKGTFLLSEKSPVLTRSLENITTYHDDIVKAGLEPRYKTLEAKVIPGEESVTSTMGLKPGDPVVYLKRLMLANNVPLVVERCYLPHALFPGISEENLNAPLYTLMLQKYNVAPHHSNQEISAVMPGVHERKLLKISESTPGILVQCLVYDNAGQVIEYSQSFHRGDKYKFRCSIG